MTVYLKFLEREKNLLRKIYLTRLLVLALIVLACFFFGTLGVRDGARSNLEEVLPSFLLLLSFLSLLGGFQVLKRKKSIKAECLAQEKDASRTSSCPDFDDTPSVDQVDHLVMEFGFNLCADIMLLLFVIVDGLVLFQKEMPNLIFICAVLCVVIYSFWHKNLNTLMSCCK